MARKTIASLEEEIRVLNRQLDEISKANTRLINEKAKLIEAEDNTFQNSCVYAQMKKDIEWLNLRVKTKEGILETKGKKIDKQAKLIQELLTENENLKKENEELKNNNFQKNIEQNNIEKVKRLENKIDNLMRENADLKTNAAINAGDLQIKLDMAKERNKNIISDYAKCSKENEQLKKQLRELETKQVGRPKKLNDDTVQKIIELRKAKKSIRAIAKELNISVGSVHNVVHNIIEQ